MTAMDGRADASREAGKQSVSRPRYVRLVAAAGALLVTLVAVLGGMGVLPTTTSSAQALALDHAPRGQRPGHGAERPAGETLPVPSASGQGRRIVFDMSEQRVWLVAGSGSVRRTYPVSGSLTDNLQPGTYSVYSKSLHAWGIEDSGTMQYMVRFAHGANAAIGFHDIPVLNGALVQTRAQLGTPRSHGCIRQWRPDAKALWAFAPVGTKVVVVA
jgi:L,D-transpeptidase catalytic domain